MDNLFKGQRVRLRAVEVEDWEYFYRMDDQTTEYGRLTDEVWFPSSKESAKAWTEVQAKAKSDQDEFRFQIETVEGGLLVGTMNTHTTNPRVGTFMYGIAIGAEHQGKGYGSEAVRLLLRYFFNECATSSTSAVTRRSMPKSTASTHPPSAFTNGWVLPSKAACAAWSTATVNTTTRSSTE